MHRSTTLARLITIVIAVIVTPVAVGLLGAGGRTWMIAAAQFAPVGIDFSRYGVPVLLQAVGILLLLLVVLTGIWSSAGLIAVGVLALFPLAAALFPALLLETYRIAPDAIPPEWLDSISYGLPLILFPVLGTMGLVLALVRRRPERTAIPLSIVGLLAVPVLLAAGAVLLSWGIGRGMFTALQRLQFEVAPDAIAAVLAGALLVIAAVFLTRWSAFALVLPALALLALSALAIMPGVFFPLLGQLPMELSRALPPLLLLGGGTAAALIYLAFTAVLLRVRMQAASARVSTPMATPYPPVAPPYPPAAAYPPAAPPYPADPQR